MEYTDSHKRKREDKSDKELEEGLATMWEMEAEMVAIDRDWRDERCQKHCTLEFCGINRVILN